MDYFLFTLALAILLSAVVRITLFLARDREMLGPGGDCGSFIPLWNGVHIAHLVPARFLPGRFTTADDRLDHCCGARSVGSYPVSAKQGQFGYDDHRVENGCGLRFFAFNH